MEAFAAFLKNLAEQSPEHLQPVYAISGARELHEATLEHLAISPLPIEVGDP